MAYSELVCIRGCIIISCSVTWRSGPQNFRTCRTKFQNGDSSCRASSACWCHWYWRRFLIGIFLALNLWNVSFATLIYPIFFTDGTLAVASSALTGRTWNGSLWLFKDRAKAPDVHYCSFLFLFFFLLIDRKLKLHNLLNHFHSNVSVHIPDTVLRTFLKVLTRRMCLTNQELLWLVIIWFIHMTLLCYSGLIL